jgi:hypothetical protein
MVVSVEEKAPERCQVWTQETSGSEPLKKCRNVKDDVKIGGSSRSRDKPKGNLVTA